MIKPGDKGFVNKLTSKLDLFYEQRQLTLNKWCQQKGVRLHQKDFRNPSKTSETGDQPVEDPERAQRQLYLILYVRASLFEPCVYQVLIRPIWNAQSCQMAASCFITFTDLDGFRWNFFYGQQAER